MTLAQWCIFVQPLASSPRVANFTRLECQHVCSLRTVPDEVAVVCGAPRLNYIAHMQPHYRGVAESLSTGLGLYCRQLLSELNVQLLMSETSTQPF